VFNIEHPRRRLCLSNRPDDLRFIRDQRKCAEPDVNFPALDAIHNLGDLGNDNATIVEASYDR